MTEPKSLNERLNEQPHWIDKCCIYCGRKYPQTILNIEGVIHHKVKPMCVNKQECRRYKKGIV